MIFVGLVGIVIPVLPGLPLVWAGVAVWAVPRADPVGWSVLGVATALAVAGSVAKYWFPGRRLRDSGVPFRTMISGAVFAVAGLFVVPVVGLILGFVLGVYLAERYRLGTHSAAWPSTVAALRSVGWSILIELGTGSAMVLAWVVGLLAD
jgi:uncharacterized protein YqgC (DUF456 family)